MDEKMKETIESNTIIHHADGTETVIVDGDAPALSESLLATSKMDGDQNLHVFVPNRHERRRLAALARRKKGGEK